MPNSLRPQGHHAPPSMGFSRQEYWSGLPFPSPGDLPDPGSNPGLLHCRQMLYRLSNKGSWQQSLLWFQQSGVKARPHHPRRRCHHYQSVTSNTHKPSMSSLSPWVLPHLSLAPAGGEEGQEFSSLLTYSLRVIDTRAHFFPSVPTPSHLPLVLERGPLSGVSG